MICDQCHQERESLTDAHDGDWLCAHCLEEDPVDPCSCPCRRCGEWLGDWLADQAHDLQHGP